MERPVAWGQNVCFDLYPMKGLVVRSPFVAWESCTCTGETLRSSLLRTSANLLWTADTRAAPTQLNPAAPSDAYAASNWTPHRSKLNTAAGRVVHPSTFLLPHWTFMMKKRWRTRITRRTTLGSDLHNWQNCMFPRKFDLLIVWNYSDRGGERWRGLYGSNIPELFIMLPQEGMSVRIFFKVTPIAKCSFLTLSQPTKNMKLLFTPIAWCLTIIIWWSKLRRVISLW